MAAVITGVAMRKMRWSMPRAAVPRSRRRCNRWMRALVSGITVTLIALVSYSAMAGVIGAGGLGNLAYLEGFQRNHGDVTLVATVTILIIVFIIQFCGDVITSLLDKR
jgi:ABC-type methionine transport system permease subunit